jgi:hypothetical protein
MSTFAADERKIRKIWTNEKVDDENHPLVWLTADALWLAKTPPPEHEAAIARLHKGLFVAALMIPLSEITALEGDENDNDWTLSYRTSASDTTEVTLSFRDNNQRDEAVRLLTEGAGAVSGVSAIDRHEVHWVRKSLLPAGALVAVAGITWLFHFEARKIAKGEKLKAVPGQFEPWFTIARWVEGWIGPTGVLIIGGALMLFCILWLIGVITTTRHRITVRQKTKPPNAATP